ncbi:MAG: ABC transporter permease, partial [Thermomicrobiales bacterium]
MTSRGSLNRIVAILLKDLRDAVRDARVLFAVLTPLAIGIFYNFAFEDDEPAPQAVVAVSEGTGGEFTQTLLAIVGLVVEVEVKELPDDQIRQEVAADNVDLGLILPPDFDNAVTNGLDPPLTAVVPEDPSFGGDYVLAAVDPALRQMSGQTPPAQITVERVEENAESLSIFDRIGARTYLVLISLIMMIVMTSLIAIPIVLAEETEKKTIEALALVASYPEIVLAKALLGMLYVACATGLLLIITRLYPKNWLMFIVTTVALGLTTIGFGLLLAGVVKSASQLNTWSGLVILPILAPVCLIDTGLPDRIQQVASLFPTGAAMKLFIDSATDLPVFDEGVISLLVVAVWGI